MFNWFKRMLPTRKKRLSKSQIVAMAKAKLVTLLQDGDHSKLIPIFEQSIIVSRGHVTYSSLEVHIGSFVQKQLTYLETVDIVIKSKWNPFSKVRAWVYFGQDVIYLNTKYVTNVNSIVGTLGHEISHLLGYTHPKKVTSTTRKYLPYTFGSYVKNESFTV